MDEDNDIVIALRRGEGCWEYAAADEIEALRAENARLREALKPFARLQKLEWKGTMFENRRDDDAVFYHHATGTSLTLGDFRAARAAMGESDE